MQILTSPGIDKYAQEKTTDHDELMVSLMKETHEKMDLPQMLTGPVEGCLLKLLVKMSGAKRVLEIGTFTGYSALSMAAGLPEDGELITLDLNPESLELARSYFEKSPHGGKIKIMEGPALDSIKSLEGSFDLVFIDADKTNYLNYYEAVLPLLRSGGVIVVDNVLWSGRVLEPKDKSDIAIDEFNKHVAKDDRVEKVLLTVRDGVYLICKL